MYFNKLFNQRVVGSSTLSRYISFYKSLVLSFRYYSKSFHFRNPVTTCLMFVIITYPFTLNNNINTANNNFLSTHSFRHGNNSLDIPFVHAYSSNLF